MKMSFHFHSFPFIWSTISVHLKIAYLYSWLTSIIYKIRWALKMQTVGLLAVKVAPRFRNSCYGSFSLPIFRVFCAKTFQVQCRTEINFYFTFTWQEIESFNQMLFYLAKLFKLLHIFFCIYHQVIKTFRTIILIYILQILVIFSKQNSTFQIKL